MNLEYGSPEVMRVADVPDPIAGEGEVLLRVRAAGLNPLDLHFLTGEPLVIRLAPPFGLTRPKRTILGSDVAGVVEVIGAGVGDLRPGDEVFGWCDGGALAEMIALPAEQLVRKPADMSFAEAGGVGVAAITALQGLRDHGAASAGDRVLILGASGGVGTFAVQIAKAMGAHVTAVCSGRNADLVRGLGADGVIDYTREDLASAGERWDLALQVAGDRTGREILDVLADDGTLVVIGGGDGAGGRVLGKLKQFARIILAGRFSGKTVKSFTARETRADLAALAEMAEGGALTPVVDRIFLLADAADAMRYLARLRARGKVVVTP